jgi:hypothetical protein
MWGVLERSFNFGPSDGGDGAHDRAGPAGLAKSALSGALTERAVTIWPSAIGACQRPWHWRLIVEPSVSLLPQLAYAMWALLGRKIIYFWHECLAAFPSRNYLQW